MMRWVKIIFGVLLASALFFSFGKTWLHKKKPTARTLATCVEEKPIVVIIASYNNEAICERNLRSIFGQNYSNYRVIYIDDASSDGTYKKVKSFVERAGQQHRTQILHNEKNQGALANITRAAQSCNDEEILAIVDGDDALAHEEVFTKINRVYSYDDVWMTYGSFVNYPTYDQEPVKCRPFPKSVVKKNSYRSYEWVSSHLKTFYAALYKEIQLKDLLYQGRFYPMASDAAYLYPLLEMAGEHVRYIPDILYLYNRVNPLNDHKVNLSLQSSCMKHICRKSPYNRLEALPQHSAVSEDSKAEVLVFSRDRPIYLYACLEALQKYMAGVGRISVIYRFSSPRFQKAYAHVKSQFPSVHFIVEDEGFHSAFIECVSDSEVAHHKYILFASDDSIIKDSVDLRTCIEALEATKGYGFYLPYGTHVDEPIVKGRDASPPPFVEWKAGIYAWKFKDGRDEWKTPNSLHMVLYHKQEVIEEIRKLSFSTPSELEALWAKKANTKKIGLFFENSRAIHLKCKLPESMHSCTEYLLEKLEAGEKIDLSPFYQIKNSSHRLHCEPHFIAQDEVQ